MGPLAELWARKAPALGPLWLLLKFTSVVFLRECQSVNQRSVPLCVNTDSVTDARVSRVAEPPASRSAAP